MTQVANKVVSVIIPAFNRTEGLKQAICSLFAQSLPRDEFEVIVVDSSPNTRNLEAVESLKSQAPFSLVCLTKAPEGPGPSRNLGAQHSNAPILAFMDSDCQASPDWLSHGVAAFTPGIGIVQGKTSPDPSGQLGVFIHTVVVEKENHIYEACNILYRREAFDAAGGFPSDRDISSLKESPIGGEDIELAWKVKRLGWKAYFADRAIVYHEVCPISPIGWLVSRRLIIWPRVVRRVPEVRAFLFARFFYDQAQALFLLGLLGTWLFLFSNWFLLLWLPYVWFRASERTHALRGAKRLVRVLPYAVKDGVSFCLLLIGSIRFRSLLL